MKLIKMFTIFVTVSFFVACFANGLIGNQFGASLVHLAKIYETGIAKMSLATTCGTFGAVTGSVLCAWLLHKITNRELTIFIGLGIAGMLTVMFIWMPTVSAFAALAFIRDIPRAFMSQTITTYLVQSWSESPRKSLFIQSEITVIIIGGIISPFIVSPFLSELPSHNAAGQISHINPLTISDENLKESNISKLLLPGNLKVPNNFTFTPKEIVKLTNNSIFMFQENVKLTNNSTTVSKKSDPANQVLIPFIIIGGTSVLISVIFTMTYMIFKLYDKVSSKNIQYVEIDSQEKKQQSKITISWSTFKVIILLISSVLVVLMYTGHSAMVTLISAFVIEGLNWSVHRGSEIVSIFLIAKLIGSILLSVVAIRIPSYIVVLCQFVLTFSGYLLTEIAINFAPELVWLGVIVTGFGSSSSHASLVVWISDCVSLSEKELTLVQLSIFTGVWIGPSFGGFLFEKYSPASFIHMGLITSAIQMLVFILAQNYVRVYNNNKNRDEDRSSTS